MFTSTRESSRTTRLSCQPAGLRQFTAAIRKRRELAVPSSVRPCGNHRAGQIVSESHNLGQRLFNHVQRHVATKRLKVVTGLIFDATIITALSSTKNADKARAPEMHQTKKGNQWYLGKADPCDDRRAANVADIAMLSDLLHSDETRVRGNQTYRGQLAMIRRQAPRAQDFVNRRY